MAAIAFDPLEYTHELEASGVPRAQAEVHAKAMTATFLHNFDALVTRDYLDTRFTEFETRVEANMDKRFVEVDKRFTEMESSTATRFAEVESSMDRRFTEVDARADKRFSDLRLEMHGEIAGVRGEVAGIRGEIGELRGTQKLQSWMLGVLIAAVLLPVLQRALDFF